MKISNGVKSAGRSQFFWTHARQGCDCNHLIKLYLNGKTVRQRTVRQDTTKFKSGTLPLNMYQTGEKIGEKLCFDGAREERIEAIEGDKYSDVSGTDLTVIWVMMNWQDKSCLFWEPLATDAISPSIRSMAYNCFYLLWFWMKCNTCISKLR